MKVSHRVDQKMIPWLNRIREHSSVIGNGYIKNPATAGSQNNPPNKRSYAPGSHRPGFSAGQLPRNWGLLAALLTTGTTGFPHSHQRRGWCAQGQAQQRSICLTLQLGVSKRATDGLWHTGGTKRNLWELKNGYDGKVCYVLLSELKKKKWENTLQKQWLPTFIISSRKESVQLSGTSPPLY